MDSNSRAHEDKSRFCRANATLRYQERGEVICAAGKGQGPPKLGAASCGGEGRDAAPWCALTVGSSSTLHFCCCCGGHCTGCLICCCCWQGAGATGTCPDTGTAGHWGVRTTTGVTSGTAVTSWQVTAPSELWQDLSLSWQEELPLWQELSELWQPLSAREHIFPLVR